MKRNFVAIYCVTYAVPHTTMGGHSAFHDSTLTYITEFQLQLW